jgi:hypothetical protein
MHGSEPGKTGTCASERPALRIVKSHGRGVRQDRDSGKGWAMRPMPEGVAASRFRPSPARDGPGRRGYPGRRRARYSPRIQ